MLKPQASVLFFFALILVILLGGCSAKEVVRCPDVHEPVCSEDGKTYRNPCVAEKQHDVKIAYEGECSSNTKTHEEGASEDSGRVVVSSGDVNSYETLEFTIREEGTAYKNPWSDASVSARFTDQEGKEYLVKGFYYDANEWRVRFAPPQAGKWAWQVSFSSPQKKWSDTGSLNVGEASSNGFMREHPQNPFRLVLEDGSFFPALGLQTCIPIPPVDEKEIPRSELKIRPLLKIDGKPTSLDDYARTYADIGFNVWRVQTESKCLFNKMFVKLSEDGNVYSVEKGFLLDELLQTLKKHEYHVYLVLFSKDEWFKNTASPGQQKILKDYMDYMIARYGAYVDSWGLVNEFTPEDAWYDFTAAYLKSIDPYDRMISTSWEQPEREDIEFIESHWYEREPEFESDARTAKRIAEYRKWNKPIIFGEQGNKIQSWDASSGLRMRLRSWTAFFEEGVFIFWVQGDKEYKHEFAANIYLGEAERKYLSVLSDFMSGVDASVSRMSITPGNAGVRAYGLQSSREMMGYFHHFTDHTSQVTTTFSVNLSKSGVITWTDPATGRVLGSTTVSKGAQQLTTPSFTVDVAFKIVYQ